jgi:two-component system sensor histidine kinase ArlS
MRMFHFQLSRLPIRWKLTVWSSMLLCLLFIAYNLVQYFVINQWMMNQEESAIQNNLKEIKGYYLDKNKRYTREQIIVSSDFIQNINQKNQLIRILDSSGKPIVTVTNDLPPDWVKPLAAEQTQLYSLWHDVEHLLLIRSPLNTGSFTGTIEVVQNLENFDQTNDIIFIVVFAGGIVAILLSWLGGSILARQLLKPIQSITLTMEKIKKRGMDERVIVADNHDEISNLARMFNEMMDELQIAFAQQKQFVEDASHELRTPISIIEGHLSLLNRWGKHEPDILEESLASSLQETNRLKVLAQELLELSRAESALPDESDMIEPAQTVTDMVQKVAELHLDFDFRLDVDELAGSEICITSHHLEQILIILLDNAVKYSIKNKVIQITGEIRDGRAVVRIIDFGMGIPQDDLPYVFQRFYRVDKARSREQGGNGLGLSIAYRLVERHSGTIEISSVEHQGTTVSISFPVISI